MKDRSIFTRQNQTLIKLFSDASHPDKVLCVPIDYAKQTHMALFCNGSGAQLKKPFAVKNNPEGLAFLLEAAERICRKHHIKREHVFFGGEEYIGKLKRRTCFDLFLFYKECLINISRHSGATRFSTRLKITPREINLTISDNGRGLPETEGNGIPASLKRRAKLLGATISVETPSTGGTSINLNLQIRNRIRFLYRGIL